MVTVHSLQVLHRGLVAQQEQWCLPSWSPSSPCSPSALAPRPSRECSPEHLDPDHTLLCDEKPPESQDVPLESKDVPLESKDVPLESKDVPGSTVPQVLGATQSPLLSEEQTTSTRDAVTLTPTLALT